MFVTESMMGASPFAIWLEKFPMGSLMVVEFYSKHNDNFHTYAVKEPKLFDLGIVLRMLKFHRFVLIMELLPLYLDCYSRHMLRLEVE